MRGDYYHKEIDGLRAISVGVIILFHLKVAPFSGGFIGVDVFFVVSGFLISQIILRGLHAQAFSFREFYLRRTARIIPALAVTVLLTLLASAWLQHPDALMSTARQSLYALLSVSNFYFWSEANYWAASAETLVLLHTWSLGVEEQFYLVYPLLLYLTHRYLGMRGVAFVLLALLVGGSIANEWVFTHDRTASFYFTPLRFYEFAVGGLGAMIFSRLQVLRSNRWLSSGLTLLGIGMILHSAVTLHPLFHTLPGFITLIPAAGALLIILAGDSAPARLLLSNPVAEWMGKVSYSLYLVHWPIIVLYRYRFGGHLSGWEQVLLVLVMCLAAELLCRHVERRFRLRGDGSATGSGGSVRGALLKTALLVSVTLAGSGLALASQGWPGRFGEEARDLLAIDANSETRERRELFRQTCLPQKRPLCGERRPDAPNILLVGDSRVLDMYFALRAAYPDAGIQASGIMGCIAVFDPKMSFSRFAPNCPKQNERRLQAVLAAPDQDIVFLANNLTALRAGAILETARRLREAGKTVYVLGEFKILEGRNPIELAIDARRFGAGDDFIEPFLVAEPFGMDGDYAARIEATGATYVSNKPFFFDGSYHLEDRATGRLLTYDGIHLNSYGARQFGQYLRENYPLPGAQGHAAQVID